MRKMDGSIDNGFSVELDSNIGRVTTFKRQGDMLKKVF